MTVDSEQSRGLRQRKKLQARQRVVTAARELFSERGYRATTVAEIAARAEMSVPTLFKYFPTKEDILFSGHETARAEWKQRLEARPATQNAIDALLEWEVEEIPKLLAANQAWNATFRRILEEDPALQESEQKHLRRSQQVLAVEIARDLDEPPDHLRPQLLATLTIAALATAYIDFRDKPNSANGDLLKPIDYASTILRAAVDAARGLPSSGY